MSRRSRRKNSQYNIKTDLLTQVEVMSSKRALYILNNHVKNQRRKRNYKVALLAEQVKNGEWKLTHQGIAFDKEGNLIDGQHRLEAIVLAGKPVNITVSYGLEPDSIRVIDTNTTRDVSDQLRVRFGIKKYTAQLGAITRTILLFDPELRMKRTPTNDEVATWINKNHESLMKFINVVKSKTTRMKLLKPPGVAAFVSAYLQNPDDDRPVKELERFVKLNFWPEDNDPFKALNNWLENESLGKHKTAKPNTARRIFLYTARALEASMKGEGLTRLFIKGVM